MSNEESNEFEALRHDFEMLNSQMKEQTQENATLLGRIRQLQDNDSQLNAGSARVESQLLQRPEPQVIFVAQERHVGRFQGKFGSDVDLEDWIRDIKSLLEAQHKTGENALRLIKNHLSGPARVEIEGHEDITSPEDVFAILRKVFSDYGNDQQKRLRIFGRRQEPDESILSYSHELIRLYQPLENDHYYLEQKDKNLTAIFVEGVRDPLLSRELNRQMLSNPSDSFFNLRDWAIDWHKRGSRDPRIRHATIKETIGSTYLPHGTQVQETTSILSLLRQQADMLNEHMEAQKQQNAAMLQLLRRADDSRPIRGASWAGNPPTVQAHRPIRSQYCATVNIPQGQRARSSCFNCGELGHFQRNCPKQRRGHVSLND